MICFNSVNFYNYSFNFILIFYEGTALHLAVKSGEKDIVKLLLAQPTTDVNAKYI